MVDAFPRHHHQQQDNRHSINYNHLFRNKLHEGVIKDVERQKQRKIENTYVLQQQIDLTKRLRQDLATTEQQQNIQTDK